MDMPQADEDALLAHDPLDVGEHVLQAENLQFDRTEDGDLAFALGLVARKSRAEPLRAALAAVPPLVRGRAAEALGLIGDATAAPAVAAMAGEYLKLPALAALAPGGPAEKAGLRGFKVVKARKKQGPFNYESTSLDRSAWTERWRVDVPLALAGLELNIGFGHYGVSPGTPFTVATSPNIART